MTPSPEFDSEGTPSPARSGSDREEFADRLRDRHRDLDPTELVEVVESHRTIGESSLSDPTPSRPPAIPSETLEADQHRGRAPRTDRRKRVRALQFGSALCALGALYYAISIYQVWSVGRAHQEQPVDAIVVMGAAQYDGRPSPQLAARLDHVLVLWPQGYAPLVVVTGGNIPGDRFTEASASADYLIERGVPDEAILRETEGSNSFESIESVAAMLDERGLDEVLIVTDPYHALRSREIAEEVGLTARVSSTDTSVVRGSDSVGRHLQEAAGVAIGRIIGFERLSELAG